MIQKENGEDLLFQREKLKEAEQKCLKALTLRPNYHLAAFTLAGFINLNLPQMSMVS